MKNKLPYTLVAVLVLFNVVSILGNAQSDAQSKQTLQSIQGQLDEIPKEPIVYNGRDGKTPQAGIDYPLPKNGANGTNSISFVTTQTIVKEVPLLGEKGDTGATGEPGKDAPTQQLRVNTDTKNLENKLSDEKYWKVLLYCTDYRNECP